MTTKDIIYRKVPAACDRWMKQKANDILIYRKCANLPVYHEESNELRGYLECLATLGHISEKDMQRIYTYYVEISEPFAIESETTI